MCSLLLSPMARVCVELSDKIVQLSLNCCTVFVRWGAITANISGMTGEDFVSRVVVATALENMVSATFRVFLRQQVEF